MSVMKCSAALGVKEAAQEGREVGKEGRREGGREGGREERRVGIWMRSLTRASCRLLRW